MFFSIKKLSTLFFVFFLFTTKGHGKPVTIKKPVAERPRLFVLAIGVNDYKEEFFPPLKWAETDAARFANEIGKDGEFNVERTVLTGAKVTKEGVEEAIRRVSVQAKSDDVFIAYVSGHGSLRLGRGGDLEPVLVLADTKSSEVSSTSLPQKQILSWMESLKVRRKILVTASCHSGVGKSRLTPEIKKILAQNKSGLTTELSDVSEGMMILSAAAKQEVAIEDDRYSSDLYTHFFLAALDVYDRNQDGSVSILEAHDYASDMTFKETKGRQRPTIQTEAIGDIDLPLRGKRTQKALPILQEYDQQFTGMEVDVNRQQKGRLPFAFPLLPGSNVVTIYSEGREDIIGEYVLQAQAGETVTVEKILAGQPFSAGPYLAVVQPDERVYAKLLGNNPSVATGIYGAWRLDRLNFSLNIQMPTRSKAEALPGIDISLAEYLMTFNSGYIAMQISSVSLNTYLLAGQSDIDMKVSDQNTGYTKTSTSSELVYGLGIGISWTPVDMKVFKLDAEVQKLNHDFGSFGSINANRKLITASFGFTFGGKARRK
jgi:hypothetical protein